jgi:hypothetical protein
MSLIVPLFCVLSNLYLDPNASSLYDMHVLYIMVESIFGLNT